MSQVTCTIYRSGEAPQALTNLDDVSEVLKDPGAFVWFDAIAPTEDDLGLIQYEFGLHPLAIEDAVKGHERPKIERYGDNWFVFVHAVSGGADALKVHSMGIFAGPQYVVTVRYDPPYPMDEAARRWNHDERFLPRTPGALLYELLDTIVDGYAIVAEGLEDRATAIEDALLDRQMHTEETLLEIFQIGRSIQHFRRAVGPMREILVPLQRGDADFVEEGERPYYRDVHDHVERVMDEMDSAKELTTKTLEVHLGIAAHRQGDVTRQLTIIATIFLPLSFITGFFGQNFGFLINGIGSEAWFIVVGIGSQVLTLAILYAYFKRKRWL